MTLTNLGISFDGGGFVVAPGHHVYSIDPDALRKLARAFTAVDFYSMSSSYHASITDCPTYTLSIAIDGHRKQVEDYMGTQVGMPQIVRDLEDEVDSVARTGRWVTGDEGLVEALRREHFDLHSREAQRILAEAASNGNTDTVRELLASGVPVDWPPPSLNALQKLQPHGYLLAAAAHPDTLAVLIDAGVSKDNAADKVLALSSAAQQGNLDSVRALIGYGADPNANLLNFLAPQQAEHTKLSGSILMSAVFSGDPDVVREILRYHPNLDARNSEGSTVAFTVTQIPHLRETAEECASLILKAGADVHARDKNGNTPLHHAGSPSIAALLLAAGADINARNNNGETPIFTTYNDDLMRFYLKHGADLTVRNNQGRSIQEALAAKHLLLSLDLNATLATQITPKQ